MLRTPVSPYDSDAGTDTGFKALVAAMIVRLVRVAECSLKIYGRPTSFVKSVGRGWQHHYRGMCTLDLQAQLREKDVTVQDLQRQVKEAEERLTLWRNCLAVEDEMHDAVTGGETERLRKDITERDEQIATLQAKVQSLDEELRCEKQMMAFEEELEDLEEPPVDPADDLRIKVLNEEIVRLSTLLKDYKG